MAVRLQSCLRSSVFVSLAVGMLFYIYWTNLNMSSLLWRPLVAKFNTIETIPLLLRKDYQKLPERDVEDEYRTDSLPSKSTQKCNNGVWKTINQDLEMKEKFIPNIRMYIHNGSITMSEWNRLSHFNNPFGFMDYSYEDVMPALNLVPKPQSPLLPRKPGKDCISCAVVGNGGILWRSGKGAEIDSHDYIIRVNGAAVEGFEEDVGSRTDVYVHSAHSITTSERLMKQFGYKGAPHDQGIKYVLIPEEVRDFQWITGLYKKERPTNGEYKDYSPWTYYFDQFDEMSFYVIHMDFLRYVRNRFLNSPPLNSGNSPIARPTSGAFMMFMALHLCDRVDAYGFITENHKKYSHYYYERGANTEMTLVPKHNFDMEMKLWKELHDLQIINLYQRQP